MSSQVIQIFFLSFCVNVKHTMAYDILLKGIKKAAERNFLSAINQTFWMMSLTFFLPSSWNFSFSLFIMFTDFKCRDMLHILYIILSLHTIQPTCVIEGCFVTTFIKILHFNKNLKNIFFTKQPSMKNSWCLNQASIMVTDRLKNGWSASRKSRCIIYSVARLLINNRLVLPSKLTM